MYEFSKKEVRKKFKETEYGRKTNIWLYISVTITLILFIILILPSKVISFSEAFYDALDSLFMVSLIVACYFDGKRDGAIEQFKRDLNKNDK